MSCPVTTKPTHSISFETQEHSRDMLLSLLSLAFSTDLFVDSGLMEMSLLNTARYILHLDVLINYSEAHTTSRCPYQLHRDT